MPEDFTHTQLGDWASSSICIFSMVTQGWTQQSDPSHLEFSLMLPLSSALIIPQQIPRFLLQELCLLHDAFQELTCSRSWVLPPLCTSGDSLDTQRGG